MLITVSVLILAGLITALAIICPQRPTLLIKQLSIPSTSTHSISSTGRTITVSGRGIMAARLVNPNWLMKQRIKEVRVEGFWVGYQGRDADYFDTAPLATGNAPIAQLTLYPREHLDLALKTTFEHSGQHNSDPIWTDFIKRCMNQDEGERRVRMVFRVQMVVKVGWWAEGRKRYLVAQELPCPMAPLQIIELLKGMQLPPPDLDQ
jgi:hypothetical protein